MQHWLSFFIALPLMAYGLSLFCSRIQERWLSGLAIGASGMHLLAQLALWGGWWHAGFPVLETKVCTLYHSAHFEFVIDFYFDRVTAVFAFAGAILTLLVSVFSRYYMHREAGYRRFFTTLLLFFTGYNLLVFSGNFETLFTGWEILGITSFLLIAFYRDRYLPVKNAYKVLSFYRIGDIFLMLAMWMSHHLWHKNILFSEWEADMILSQMDEHFGAMAFLSGMLVLAAAIKSAQFPFFTWLPRAMEGPSTSSAIFYGALSVHIGVFVLLRTAPLWEHTPFFRGLIAGVGVLTVLTAAGVARVQSSIKTRIAYASVIQLGIMFVEVGLGFYTLALVHFMGNAFLRTYQLLVSPSVLSYWIHDMFFSFSPKKNNGNNHPLINALYVLSIKEWNLDTSWLRWVWRPFKWAGNHFSAITGAVLAALIAGYQWASAGAVSTGVGWLALAALALVLKSFAYRGDARRAWWLVIAGQGFMAASIFVNSDTIQLHQIGWYISGPIVAATAGTWILQQLFVADRDIILERHHGYSHSFPVWSLVFLLAGLGLSGFPITPTFIGIDLMFTHIRHGQGVLATLAGLVFLFTELAVLRIYARVFLGPYKKMSHPVAFHSS